MDILSPVVVAVITGLIAGVISSLGTVASLRVHIEYIKAAIDKHEQRLQDVEKEQHTIATAVGVSKQLGAGAR